MNVISLEDEKAVVITGHAVEVFNWAMDEEFDPDQAYTLEYLVARGAMEAADEGRFGRPTPDHLSRQTIADVADDIGTALLRSGRQLVTAAV